MSEQSKQSSPLSPLPPVNNSGLVLEPMPLVVVKYCGLQEGFAQLAPRALFNVVGGEVPDLIRSTVTLESLYAKGYRIKEAKAGTFNIQHSTFNAQVETKGVV